MPSKWRYLAGAGVLLVTVFILIAGMLALASVMVGPPGGDWANVWLYALTAVGMTVGVALILGGAMWVINRIVFGGRGGRY